jgi:hypothetical protein
MPDVTKVITTKDYVIGETLVFEGELLYATENLSDEGFKKYFNVYSSGGILGPVAGTWQEYGGGLFREEGTSPDLDEVSNLGELSIEIFDPTVGNWAQAKYLVHGHDDVLWTGSPYEAAKYLTDSLLDMEKEG